MVLKLASLGARRLNEGAAFGGRAPAASPQSTATFEDRAAYVVGTPTRGRTMRTPPRTPPRTPRPDSPDRLAPVVDAVLAALAGELAAECPPRAPRGEPCSNELTEVRLVVARTLVIKRARYAWDGERFRASRVAADLLRRRTGVLAPHQLDVGPEVDGRAVEAYWRIELPTLRERWPALAEEERRRALRSWGGLLRRVHKVRLAGHGPLPRAVREPSSLARFLAEELERRLPPAVAAHWPAARDAVRALRALVPDVARRLGPGPGVLLHNDPHLGNVLCEARGRRVRCVGVIDLEAAVAGPPESDLAHLQVLHGPLLGCPLPGGWFEHVLEGYGAPADPATLAFYRAYHLVNLGVHAAMVGLHGHAADVAGAVRYEVATLADGPARAAPAQR